MIQIKAVDAQNILDVCGLSTDRNGVGTITKGCSCCNAISIAEAKYDSEMHPYAIYHNKVLIGFFMYRRTEEQADTVTVPYGGKSEPYGKRLIQFQARDYRRR